METLPATAAPLTTGNEFLFHCYLFPVPLPNTQKTAGRAQKKKKQNGQPKSVHVRPKTTTKTTETRRKPQGKTHRKRQEAQDFSASAGFPWEEGRLPDGGAAQKSEKVRNPECGGPYITPVEHCMPMVYTYCGEDITGGT